MTRLEAETRTAAASKRIAAANPLAMPVVLAWAIAAWCVRGMIHCSMALAVCSMAGWSYWLSRALAVLSGQTIGRVWEFAVRGRRVRALESLADSLERTAS